MAGTYNRRRAAELDSWSIPRWFLARCEATPDAVAFRHKDLGLYHEVTWTAYRDLVEAFLAGIESLGFRAGDSFAAMSDPCWEYLVADMAALGAGGICYGIYTTCSVVEVAHQLRDGGARIFFAEDQEFVDKILAAPDGLPQVEHIIAADTRALFRYRDPRIVSFAEVLRRGRAALGTAGRVPGALLAERAETIAGEDVAVLVYTSGTTGLPKGAMHDHASLMWGFANAYLEAFPELDQGVHPAVSHLPMAHLIERSMTQCLPLVADVVPHIGEEVENLVGTLYEVQPTFLNVVPRILEKMASQIVTGMQRSSPLKRLAYAVALAVGERYRAALWRRGRAGLFSPAYRLARWLVFRPLLREIGLARLRSVLCAGAPLPPRVHALWQAWGVNVRNLYGITEGGYVLCQDGAFPPPELGGKPIFPRRVKLAPDGELLVTGKGLFRGYWNNPAGTAATMEDAWLCTGDIADEGPPGVFRIVDRKKDIMITSGGKNVAPSEIENLLKSSPYVSEALLVGDGRKFVSALIEIDYTTLTEWARRHKVPYTSFLSLVSEPAVVDLIAQEVETANEALARVEQVKKFRIIPKILDPEEGETTPTRKVKRSHLHEQFRDLIEEMYRDDTNKKTA